MKPRVPRDRWFAVVDRRVAGKSVPRDDSFGKSQTHDRDLLAAWQVAVELAGDVALQDADDVALRASLLHLALEVGDGPRVVRDAHHDDAPDRRVLLAVPTAV